MAVPRQRLARGRLTLEPGPWYPHDGRGASVQHHWKDVGRYGTLGLDIALSVIVGLVGGQWLDGKLGTGPWLALLGFCFGVAAGFRFLWRALRRANREAERADEEEREERRRYHGRGR